MRPQTLLFLCVIGSICLTGCRASVSTPAATAPISAAAPTRQPEFTAAPTITHTPSATLPAPSHTPPAPTATSLSQRIEIHFDNLSLLWRECELPRPQDQSQEECLGVTMAINNPDDASPFAERFTPPGGIMPGWRLTIGSDIYEAVHQPYNEKSFTNPKGEAEHRLYKNGELLLTIESSLMGFENASLMNIHGKYAWEFADLAEPTVIYDGVDLRLKFGLEGLYRPQVIGENIVFVAKDNGKMFVIVDGKQIGPAFDDISNGYCCETTYILRPPGQLWFWGSREGRHFVVVITASP